MVKKNDDDDDGDGVDDDDIVDDDDGDDDDGPGSGRLLMSCWSRDRASTSSGCTLCASARVQFSFIQLSLCGFTHQLPRKSVVFDIFCSSTFFYSRRNTANAYNICILLSIIFALKCILDSSVFCSQVYLALQCILFYSSEV